MPKCPSCQAALKLPAKTLTKPVQCPKCKAWLKTSSFDEQQLMLATALVTTTGPKSVSAPSRARAMQSNPSPALPIQSAESLSSATSDRITARKRRDRLVPFLVVIGLAGLLVTFFVLAGKELIGKPVAQQLAPVAENAGPQQANNQKVDQVEVAQAQPVAPFSFAPSVVSGKFYAGHGAIETHPTVNGISECF